MEKIGSCYNRRMTSGKNEGSDPPLIEIQVQVDLPPGDSVSITVESLTGDGGAPSATSQVPATGEHLGTAPERSDKTRPRPSFPKFPSIGRWFTPDTASVRPGIFEFTKTLSLDVVLFGLSIFTYLCTRFIGLVNFPIFFFTDEAVQTVLAADFVRDHLRNYDGDLLPTFFVNGGQYNLSTSVYLQVIP
jgi:hypothetical protein